VLLALACVAGCGVRRQDEPRQVPAAEVPAELAATPGAAAPGQAARVVVYLVEGDRLVRQEAPAARRDVSQALLSLLTAPDPPGPRRSAVPAGTALRRLRMDGDALTVDLSAPFAQARGQDQLLAVAQLVWTATEFAAVRRLALFVDGEALAVPGQGGAVESGPTTRADYRTVGPRG